MGTVAAFCSWMAEHSVEWNTSVLSIQGTIPGTLSITASRDIEERTDLACIPKEACITIYTTDITDVLAEEELAGGLGLTIAVWYEKGIGESSKWSGYFNSIRDREYLPVFWSKEELEYLDGTEVDPIVCVEGDAEDIRDDYEQHVAPLLEKYTEIFGRMSDTSVQSFMEAASLVASRAFAVDEDHGDGMVPLADVFNHKVSMVKLTKEYRIHGSEETSDEEENTEGVVAERSEDEQVIGAEGSPNASSSSDSATFFPEPCAMPESDLTMCGMTQANGLNLKLHIAIIDDSDNDCLQIIAASSIEQGKEVFNTYGELGNAELLKKYGFCVPQNPFSYVRLNKSRVIDSLRESWPKESKKRRGRHGKPAEQVDAVLAMLKDQTGLIDDSDDEPFMIFPNGFVNISICIFCLVIVHSLLDTEYSSIEDLVEKDDHVTAVIDGGVPVRLIDFLTSICPHDPHGRALCMDAFVDAVRERRKTYETVAGTPLPAAQVLRDSEIEILDQFGQ